MRARVGASDSGAVIDSCATHSHPPAVGGMPLTFLRAEGAVLLTAALATYFTGLNQPFWLVPALLLAPDLFMVGYAKSSRVGAWLYNFAHSYPVPEQLSNVVDRGVSAAGG